MLFLERKVIFGGEKNCTWWRDNLYFMERKNIFGGEKLGSLPAISLSVPVNLAICHDTSVWNKIYRLFQKYFPFIPEYLEHHII